jgi:oxygen-dependent protoporphyrinogen oxidase
MGPLGPSSFERVFRYVENRPQPTVGHKERLRRIEHELEIFPGLQVAGAAYDGVGIPDCVRQARSAAERLSQALP